MRTVIYVSELGTGPLMTTIQQILRDSRDVRGPAWYGDMSIERGPNGIACVFDEQLLVLPVLFNDPGVIITRVRINENVSYCDPPLGDYVTTDKQACAVVKDTEQGKPLGLKKLSAWGDTLDAVLDLRSAIITHAVTPIRPCPPFEPSKEPA